jgi:hypothetical protein
MREVIISLEERRPPKAKRAEPSGEQESLGPGWTHVVKAKEETEKNFLSPNVRLERGNYKPKGKQVTNRKTGGAFRRARESGT